MLIISIILFLHFQITRFYVSKYYATFLFWKFLLQLIRFCMRAHDFRFIADMFSKPLDFRGVMKMKYVSQSQYGHSQSEKKLVVGDKYHRSIKVHT